MPDKKDIIIIALLCVIALGLGYWVGLPEKTVDKPKAATPSNNATKTIRKLTVEEEKVIGTYELKEDGNTERVVLLDNGIMELYKNGKKEDRDGKWKITKEGELQVTIADGGIIVFSINKDGSITAIAEITKDGEREDYPKGLSRALKKIK